MSERKSISKGVRFEIFKRDGFKCLYCGKTPPDTVLHVDHIIPVSNGGTNDLANLATACSDCNLGKGAKLLEARPKPLTDNLAAEEERLEQLRAYNEHLSRKLSLERDSLDQIDRAWVKLEGGNPEEVSISEYRENLAKQFLKRLSAQQIIEALEITYNNTNLLGYQQDRYFCGVCWRKIKGDYPFPKKIDTLKNEHTGEL